MLSGMAPNGAIGGTINFAPKRATVRADHPAHGALCQQRPVRRQHRLRPPLRAGRQRRPAPQCGVHEWQHVGLQPDRHAAQPDGGLRLPRREHPASTPTSATPTATSRARRAARSSAPAFSCHPPPMHRTTTTRRGCSSSSPKPTACCVSSMTSPPGITAYAKVGGRRTNGAFALCLPDHHPQLGRHHRGTQQQHELQRSGQRRHRRAGRALRPARSSTKPWVSGQLLSTWTGSFHRGRCRPSPRTSTRPACRRGRTWMSRCRGRCRRRSRC